jgi:Astacin (Peptidase family M12A)
VHQQNAYDRDDYITVRLENVNPSLHHNFEIASEATHSQFNTPYDYRFFELKFSYKTIADYFFSV